MRSKLSRLMSRSEPRSREVRSRPKKPVETMDKTTPHVAPPGLAEWQVVMLSPSANDGTLERIAAAGFHVWRPRMVRLISAASVGRAAYVNRPLWPRYAFVARMPGCTTSLNDVWNVGSLLILGNVLGQTVEAISHREGCGEFDCRKLPPAGFSFDPGASVETLDGLMAGIALKSDDERTTVLFRLLDADREVQMETRRLKMKATA